MPIGQSVKAENPPTAVKLTAEQRQEVTEEAAMRAELVIHSGLADADRNLTEPHKILAAYHYLQP